MQNDVSMPAYQWGSDEVREAYLAMMRNMGTIDGLLRAYERERTERQSRVS